MSQYLSRLGLALAIFVASLSIRAAEPATAKPFALLGKGSVADGRLLAPFYDYMIWPHAVEDKGTVYCVFSNARAQPIAMAYDTAAQRFSRPVKVSEFGLKNDDHGNPALCLDRKGHLHVFYGCHTGPMRHAKSQRPRDISAWTEQSPPTPKATYPQVMRLADGKVCLFYRAGGHMEPWTLRESSDDMQTWGEPQRIVEMRLDPPDRLAAAYASFLPGARGETIHLFWCHKDDNPPKVSAAKPHPWRPLKYPGLHEAVYRYNIYYLKRLADGQWQTAAGEAVTLPVSKAEADKKCLVFDSGDEFTMLGRRIMVDADDRPYIRFGTGVHDWVGKRGEPVPAIVPVTDRFATFAAGRWQVSRALPDDWPAEIKRVNAAPGVLAAGDRWPGGQWFLSAGRRAIQPDAGCQVYLWSEATGYVAPEDGPARVE